MGLGSGGQRGTVPPSWIFIHDTDKVEGGLTMLFFGLVSSVGPPESFYANALAEDINFKHHLRSMIFPQYYSRIPEPIFWGKKLVRFGQNYGKIEMKFGQK